MFNLTEISVPFIFSTKIYKRSWFAHGHRRLLDVKHEAFLRWQEEGTPESHAAFKKARNTLKGATRKARRQSEIHIAEKASTNSKAFFAYIRRKRELRTDIVNIRREDGTLSSDPAEQADILKNFYSSIYREDRGSPLPHLPAIQIPPTLRMQALLISPPDC